MSLAAVLAGAMFLVPTGMAGGAAVPIGLDEWLQLASDGNLPTECRYTRDLALPAPKLVPKVPNLLEPCAGIRPGGTFTNVGCTMNFVFTDGANLYIGTAGHCATVGTRMSNFAAGGQFGTVVYSINAGLGNDFALIKIDANKVALVNPQLCAFGGPAGVNNGETGFGQFVYEYGWGIATQVSTATRARIHVQEYQDANDAGWIGEGSGGDSGAPMIDENGNAFAIHTHGITPVLGVYGEAGTYIRRILSLAQGAGFNISVVTAGGFDAEAAQEIGLGLRGGAEA
jgi:hypothetical protein